MMPGSVDRLLSRIVDAIWFNQSQVCCAGSRLLVQELIEDRFIIETNEAHVDAGRVGDPLDKSVDIGALVAPVQVERIKDLMRRGAMEGAVIYEPDGARRAPEVSALFRCRLGYCAGDFGGGLHHMDIKDVAQRIRISAPYQRIHDFFVILDRLLPLQRRLAREKTDHVDLAEQLMIDRNQRAVAGDLEYSRGSPDSP